MDIWLFLFNQFFIDKKFRSLNIIFQYYKCTDLWHIFLTIFSGNNSNILISAAKCIHVFKIFHWVLNYSRKFFYFLIRVRKKMKKQLVSRSVLFDNSGLYISECIPRYILARLLFFISLSMSSSPGTELSCCSFAADRPDRCPPNLRSRHYSILHT